MDNAEQVPIRVHNGNNEIAAILHRNPASPWNDVVEYIPGQNPLGSMELTGAQESETTDPAQSALE